MSLDALLGREVDQRNGFEYISENGDMDEGA
eukprot:CAMPEP_0168624794 /NCGR_PEP_ID=MMETSP0449_2-20121227/9627_1 /TAXON_ID=1082188 /ORGANISM="Strombidium rassoulzadegani, Strain ras09" /LENGTH=30 /DNA_ID= /DNA_START= /DNA_END= /DNA_ORIENTATION=